MLGVVVQIDGFDPVAGQSVTLRAASHDVAEVCHLGGALFWPTIAKLPKLRYDFFDGAFETQISAPSSALTLGIEPWPLFGRYALADARFRLWTGEVGAPWAGWTQRFDGRVTQQPTFADARAELAVAVDDRWLDKALLATYAGTGGAEGPAALKGQVKPLALGAPRYVAGVLVDAVNSVFQVSAYGPVIGVSAALERLLRYGPSLGDYPTFDALVAAAIPAGRWATCRAAGLVRLGAPPMGQISLLVDGDNGGPDGWARTPGQLIRRIARLAGGEGRIDDASLDALDAARPYPTSVYLDQQITAREVIQQIAASVNAVVGVSWLGKLFAAPIAIGAPALTLAADGTALPPVRKVSQLEIAPPFAKLGLSAERAWTVHQLADIAFTATLTDLGAYAAGTTYREGNIVQAGGSSWLYINPAASAGNAPPALPIEQNSYWKVLAKAGSKGDPGDSAPLLRVQWSIDGLSGWHDDMASADVYYHQSNDDGATWGPAIKGVGRDGAPGYNNAQPMIYQRATSAPPLPSTTAVYTFATSTLTNVNNGWLTNGIPDGTDPVWASSATASSQGATDTIAPGEWATPVRAFANGAAGGSGLNSKSIFIYQRATSAPAAPSATATYTFSSATLSDLNNGWSTTIPDGTGIVWVTTASALSASDTDTIAPGEWAAVAKLAQDGAAGVSPLLVTAQPAALQLQGDTAGAAVPGSLPAYIENSASRAGVSAAITDVTIDATSGCTATVADDETTIAITAISKATASVSYTVSAAGLTQQVKVGITVLRAPTSLEERGLNISSGGTSTSYDVFGGTISIQAGSSGKIDTLLSGTYYSGGSGAIGETRLQTKHQYRLPSGSWVDVSGSEGMGSSATRANGGPGEPPENNPGSPYGAIGHITGLNPGTFYEVRALAYYDTSAGTNSKPATGVGCTLIAKQVA